MAVRRRKKRAFSAVPAPLRWPVTFLIGPGRPLALALLVIGILVGACIALWPKVGDNLLASDQYQVTAANLEVTPLPDWIRSDPRQWVADYIGLKGPLSIMDDDATERVANAFKLHPWVEHVIRVTKHHPARIRAELKYRRPVCLVFCTIRGEEQLCPVDVRGVWLPADDFQPRDPAEYPIVVGIKSTPVSSPGMPWRDECVVGAAEIANAFGHAWRELDLHRIAPTGRVASGARAECTYDLYTRRGRRILWGYSPGTIAAGEPPTEEKISQLRQYAATHGGLDGPRSKEPIDLRRPVAPQVPAPVAAASRDEQRRH